MPLHLWFLLLASLIMSDQEIVAPRVTFVNECPMISIVTPVLNGDRYIAALIDSLQRQNFQAWEHIVVDGGSSDTTIDCVKSTYAGDPRVTLIERPGLGLYASVIEGLKASRGSILGWQNADDMYTPWAFSAIARYRAKTNADWITGLPGCWDDKGELRFVRPYGWYPRTLIKNGWFHANLLGFIQQESIFFSREAFASLSERELADVAGAKLAGDYMLWKRLARNYRLQVLPTVVSGFRRHETNRSRLGFADYMSEVRQDGGRFFPRPMSVILRQIFRCSSACFSLRRVETEDRALNLGVSDESQRK